MKNYSIKFPKISDNINFSRFANEIGGQIQADDVIQLSGTIARGTVKKIQFNADFRLCAWDMVFHCPLDLSKEISPEQVSNSYSIIYVLTPESIAIMNIDQHPQYGRLQNKSTLLLSDNVYADFELQANQPVRLLYINIAAPWLRQQMQTAGISLNDLDNDEAGSAPVIIIEPCTTSEAQATCRLFNSIMQAGDETAMLEESAFTLLKDFLEKLANKGNGRVNSSGKNVYYTKVTEAEEILRAHLQTNLPTLDKIAKQVALSESTLKRHFKAVYGKNIYQYYLEQKMNLAKDLLLEKPLTVNETAEILGYEKVSNFIDIFKKHHGFSPGRMKKRMEFSKA